MASCTFWDTIMKPTAGRWNALRCDCGESWELRNAANLGICWQHPGIGFGAAHFFLPDADLSRIGAHDHGPGARAPGNIRSRNRTQAENQPQERRTYVPHPGTFLA